MTKRKKIPNSNEIKMFFHCVNCFSDMPIGITPKQWVSIEAGWTELGLQVWCKRCDMNIIHIDFQGKKHPANITGNKATIERTKH